MFRAHRAGLPRAWHLRAGAHPAHRDLPAVCDQLRRSASVDRFRNRVSVFLVALRAHPVATALSSCAWTCHRGASRFHSTYRKVLPATRHASCWPCASSEPTMKPLLQTGLCGLLLVAGCAPGGNASPDPGQGNPNTGKADDGRSQPDDFSPPDSPLGELAVDRGEDPDTFAAEQAQFAMWAQEIRGIQDRLAYKNGNTIQRGFHAKSHLCVPGQLTLRDDRPDYTRFGIFSSSAARSYPVLMRFSNGVGFHQSDLLPDVRGLAVKVMGVSGLGTKLREDAVASDAQDFLTTNSPSQLAPDAAGFMEFARTQDDPDAFIAWGIRHPILSARLAARTAVPPTSLAGQIFYSDGAYRLGPRAVRF